MINIVNNSQRDTRWANIPVGTGDQTIGQVGCTITVIGDILGLTPPEVNEALKKVNGFDINEVIWDKIAEAFPETVVKRVWSYDNAGVLANVPNVIVEVPATPIGGRGSHWVRYIGNHQIDDPWTGIVRPTSDFPNPTGYCVIIPKTAPNTIPTIPQPNGTNIVTDDEFAAVLVLKEHVISSTDQNNQPFGNLEGYANTLTQDAYAFWRNPPKPDLSSRQQNILNFFKSLGIS